MSNFEDRKVTLEDIKKQYEWDKNVNNESETVGLIIKYLEQLS